ncbi:MAG: SDR family oxidoreductase [bacterium]
MARGGAHPLAGKRIVLTGASRGIGRAVALRLAGAGARVLAAARGEEALAALAREAEPLAGEIFPHPCDVTRPAEVEALTEAARERLGGVDALVNNAGAGVFRPLEDLSPEDFDATLAVCLRAPYLLIRSLCPLLEQGGGDEEGGGDIVNISSICAVAGFPGAAAYSAAKAGLEGMTRALVEELRPRGIRIALLRPGATATRMWRDIPGEFDLEKMVPPEMVAESVEFLLSQSRRAWTETLTIYPPGGSVEAASAGD